MRLSEATDILFQGDECLRCGHLKGDHERYPGTIVWTCDDDCDFDICTPGSVS